MDSSLRKKMPSTQHPQNAKDHIATNQKALKSLAG
jgi:hypothetical protein